MDSDFQVSREQIHMYLESQPGVPWSTLNYIIAEVNYGGRVTDDKDVRLISAFLYRYFNEGVLEDGYLLSPLEAYHAPKEGSLAEVREFINRLPQDEDPQVFGLHSNALITAQTQSAKKFMDTILSVQPRSMAAGGGKKPEEIAAEMAEGFLSRLPAKMSVKDAHEETYKPTPDGGIVSLGVFHKQESDRFNDLLAVMQKSLEQLQNALKGIVVMSSQLEDMFSAFLVQRTPPVWESVSYPCLKPLTAWMLDFQDRLAFMTRWLKEGPPSSFWVPCFYFPQGFMTASMQVHARATKIPIDTLTFWTEPTSFVDIENVPFQEKGVNVHGLFLQGASWSVDDKRIAESEPAVLFKQLPVIWLNPLLQADFANCEKEPGRYTCPLYKTSERRGTLATTGHSTNFVTYFFLPSSEHDQGHWVRRGVALLCMLDD
jgi:dynein heavy chain